MPRRSGDTHIDGRDRDLLLRLEQHGWFVMKVGAGDGEPAFAYSLGLFENFNHPEIILFGLDLDTMHTLINLNPAVEPVQTGAGNAATGPLG